MKKTCIIIAGPTASGKTAIAIQLAKYFSTEIISADSRQCYKELNIGVAKPTPQQLSETRHHFISSHSIHENLTAADFEKIAVDATQTIFQLNDVAVMVGGTGLYIKAFCEGLDNMPAIPDNIRTDIINNYNDHGIVWLQEEIEKEDPLYFTSGEMKNPQRLMRALEVKRSTGRSITELQSGEIKPRDFQIIKICLAVEREVLYSRINQRVDEMFAGGLVKEAERLISFKHLNALQAVGYKELFEFFDERYSLDRASELIKQNTRHYAKRQVTWFKKDPEFTWLAPDVEVIKRYVQDRLTSWDG